MKAESAALIGDTGGWHEICPRIGSLVPLEEHASRPEKNFDEAKAVEVTLNEATTRLGLVSFVSSTHESSECNQAFTIDVLR